MRQATITLPDGASKDDLKTGENLKPNLNLNLKLTLKLRLRLRLRLKLKENTNKLLEAG